MPNPWLNVHKSTAAMNYFFSNMTNTVIFMNLGYLRIRQTMAVLFSPLHIWIRILVVYIVKISHGRWPKHPSGENPRWVRFHRMFVYTCKQSNIMCSCCVWPHGNGLVGFYSLQKLLKLCFQSVIWVRRWYIPTYTNWWYIGHHIRIKYYCFHLNIYYHLY
jgi:hypothetical protein